MTHDEPRGGAIQRSIGSADPRSDAAGGRALRSVARFLRVPDWGIQLPVLWAATSAYFLVLETGLADYVTRVTLVSVVQVFALISVYTLNDFFDRDADRFKPTGLAPVGSPTGKFVTAGIALGSALYVAHLTFDSDLALAILWGQFALGIAYSVPGTRLKERGLVGVLIPAAAQRLAPFAMLCAMVTVDRAAMMALMGWLFMIGLLFIVEHQLQDRETDRLGGVRTFIGSLDLPAALALRKRLYRGLRLLGVVMGAALLVSGINPRTLLALACVVGASEAIHALLRYHYAADSTVR